MYWAICAIVGLAYGFTSAAFGIMITDPLYWAMMIPLAILTSVVAYKITKPG